ncbi:hypothetical protein [Burkholderia cepacia]|uniref:hypothetical protein n=1 Tax=Burkholderia cepacia TaxID=292 RepID=UPI001CF246F5|nr:hypothetical protein [Burkholderia cepacia]MCA7933238.1 hypothetical protein [Burkholderia cepacia]MCA8115698.1 hypothetical protein [Burkholderia cepacia]MCA8399761.1 hypothetical protein [Burkholderia cepacia]
MFTVGLLVWKDGPERARRLADETAADAMAEAAGTRGFIARMAMEKAICERKSRTTDVSRQDANARRDERLHRARLLSLHDGYCAVDRA